VIFSDDKRYWQTFEPICRELNERGFDMTYLTMSENDPALQASYPFLHVEYIGEGNKAFARLNFLKTTMVFATTPGLETYQWKRSKDVSFYIHIPHGANDSTTGYRSFGLDYYDGVMLSGQYQEDAMRELEKLRDLPEKEAVMIGVPYLDELAERFRKSPALPPHTRTVLVAPTWGTSSLFSRFGESMIQALVGTGYHIIMRPHPQSFTADKELMEKLMNQFPDSDQIEWNRDADNFEVLRKSDIMISDYSGVIFDFAFVFDRPVICADTRMSTDPLDTWWLGKALWAVDALPRIGPVLTEEKLPQLKELIDRAIEDHSFAESRHQARDETWAYQGEGAKRAADYLIGKYRELTEANENTDNIQKDENKPEP
jgi:CDP-glycerol glycerophosphotransferase (TagB/SpsB family)